MEEVTRRRGKTFRPRGTHPSLVSIQYFIVILTTRIEIFFISGRWTPSMQLSDQLTEAGVPFEGWRPQVAQRSRLHTTET